jgi:hypothetical protein
MVPSLANNDFVMSGLTKKAVYVDEVLSSILGVNRGELVSYAELSKGLHKYIKENKLRNPQGGKSAPPIDQGAIQAKPQRALPGESTMKNCRDCGAEIPSSAVYCDLCGVSQ